MRESEFKKGIQAIRSIKLEEYEKEKILKSIIGIPAASPYFFSSLKSLYAGMAVLLLFIAGGAALYAAESSLPGDALYAIKVDVSEPVRGFLNVEPEKKAEWEGVKAIRRLEEAADLAVKGQLSPETRTDIENRFEKHVDAFDQSVSQAPTTSPEANLMKIELEENISARARIFNDLSRSEEEDASQDMLMMQAKIAPEETAKGGAAEEETTKSEISKDEKTKEELKKLKDSIASKLKKRRDQRDAEAVREAR